MSRGRPKGGNSSSHYIGGMSFRSKMKFKCVVPKCKNTASRKTPEGEPVCRTHLARRNMFGAVDAESPTVSSVGAKNNQYRSGFNIVSATQERQSGYVEDLVNVKSTLKNKRLRDIRRRHLRGEKSKTNSYKDFIRDRGLDNE